MYKQWLNNKQQQWKGERRGPAESWPPSTCYYPRLNEHQKKKKKKKKKKKEWLYLHW